MQSGLFIVFFMILASCVIALMSLLSYKSNKEKEELEMPVIISIDNEIVQTMKQIYFTFVEAIRLKNSKILKEICTAEFIKSINIKKASGSKIVCITSNKILSVNENTVEMEFFSRSINTEILYNKCKFILSNKKFKLDSVTI